MSRATGGARFGALLLAFACACGSPKEPPRTTAASTRTRDVALAKDRPPVALLARDGDPRGAFGVAVRTDGVLGARGAEGAVAMAALVEARLAARGVRDVGVVAGWDGFRVRGLIASVADARALPEVLRAAMVEPVRGDAAELLAVQRKLVALAHRPMPDFALYDAVRCTGELFALPSSGAPASDAASSVGPPSAPPLEAWRSAVHGLGRVAMAVVGSASLVDAFADAVARAPAWPRAAGDATGGGSGAQSGMPLDAWPRSEGPEVYDATSELTDGRMQPGLRADAGARLTLAIRTARAEDAMAAAEGLGDPRGALASRLGALEAPAKIRDVTAAVHANGGCLAVTLDLAAKDLGADAPARIATAVALARQELLVELAEAPGLAASSRSIANRAGDPRDAAERAAWWMLAPREVSPPALGTSSGAVDAAREPPRVAIAVGLASPRDAVPSEAAVEARKASIRAEIDRATLAWREPVVEARSRVEQGQEELWVLLGSPCGTSPEVLGDAGLGALAAVATAEHANEAGRALDVAAEGWATSDGVGVIVHAPSGAGESSVGLARRVADAAARSFAADPLDPGAITRARASLLARATGAEDARAFESLAVLLAPGHPSWITPYGTPDALGRSSDAALLMRLVAMRSGPLRVAVLANADAAQSDAAVRAVDRWIARRPGEVRGCPAVSTPSPVHPGTYAVEVSGASTNEAWLALPLPPNDESARADASLLAAALDGPDGLLARALSAGLARSWSARVVGPARAQSLVVRVASAQAGLDAAVAQTRALFDRLRQGALVEADRARALSRTVASELAASLDPRARLVSLWRSGPEPAPPPTLDALRAFAGSTLHDDALIILAVRPPRLPSKAP